MQTQHSVDWKVSIGAEGAVASTGAAAMGGADGASSSGGADGPDGAAPSKFPDNLASSLSCIAAYSSTQTKIFCLKYVLWIPSWKIKGCNDY